MAHLNSGDLEVTRERCTQQLAMARGSMLRAEELASRAMEMVIECQHLRAVLEDAEVEPQARAQLARFDPRRVAPAA